MKEEQFGFDIYDRQQGAQTGASQKEAGARQTAETGRREPDEVWSASEDAGETWNMPADTDEAWSASADTGETWNMPAGTDGMWSAPFEPDEDPESDEPEREDEHRRKREEARERQQKNRKKSLYLQFGIAGAVMLVSIAVLITVFAVRRGGGEEADPKAIATENQTPGILDEARRAPEPTEEAVPVWNFEAHLTDETAGFAETVVSEKGILIDVETGDILAQKGAYDRISPASMTKILTALVAAEHITPEQLDDTFTMTIEITDYSFRNGCSNAGFEVGEEVTVRDLFYGTMLPSGADAAVGLATYVAGSQEAFVELMNEKLAQMGLSETTHFTNCVGLYDEDHYSTVYDMAIILKAATDNEWCHEVMSARKYTTSATEQHEEGLIISNWFLRRIEDKDTHGEVQCAKTGFVNQSGSCAASLANDDAGREYICVTAGSTSSWRCIYDHVDIYTQYLPTE